MSLVRKEFFVCGVRFILQSIFGEFVLVGSQDNIRNFGSILRNRDHFTFIHQFDHCYSIETKAC